MQVLPKKHLYKEKFNFSKESVWQEALNAKISYLHITLVMTSYKFPYLFFQRIRSVRKWYKQDAIHPVEPDLHPDQVPKHQTLETKSNWKKNFVRKEEIREKIQYEKCYTDGHLSGMVCWIRNGLLNNNNKMFFLIIKQDPSLLYIRVLEACSKHP